MNDYVDKLNRYVRDTAEFANRAIAHLDDAERYARCEAAEVAKQHE